MGAGVRDQGGRDREPETPAPRRRDRTDADDLGDRADGLVLAGRERVPRAVERRRELGPAGRDPVGDTGGGAGRGGEAEGGVRGGDGGLQGGVVRADHPYGDALGRRYGERLALQDHQRVLVHGEPCRRHGGPQPGCRLRDPLEGLGHAQLPLPGPYLLHVLDRDRAAFVPERGAGVVGPALPLLHEQGQRPERLGAGGGTGDGVVVRLDSLQHRHIQAAGPGRRSRISGLPRPSEFRTAPPTVPLCGSRPRSS